jgi:hypothetical protein
MEIMQRREVWIHTHFVTDCVRLSQAQGREIEAALLPILRQYHLVYGIHFEESRHDPGIRIVLECIPRRGVLEQIEVALLGLSNSSSTPTSTGIKRRRHR